MNKGERALWLSRARPEGILTPSEGDRAGAFVALFQEQVGRLAVDPDHPTPSELIAARRVAHQLWTLDRYCENADFMGLLKHEPVLLRRQKLFGEIDLQQRLMDSALANIRSMEDLLELLRRTRTMEADTTVALEVV